MLLSNFVVALENFHNFVVECEKYQNVRVIESTNMWKPPSPPPLFNSMSKSFLNSEKCVGNSAFPVVMTLIFVTSESVPAVVGTWTNGSLLPLASSTPYTQDCVVELIFPIQGKTVINMTVQQIGLSILLVSMDKLPLKTFLPPEFSDMLTFFTSSPELVKLPIESSFFLFQLDWEHLKNSLTKK